MRKISLQFFLLLLLFSIFFSGCKKEKLPNATQEGKGTFGCKVNGKIYLPKADNSLFGNPSAILVDNTQIDGFFVTARQFGTLDYSVTIAIPPYMTSTGVYELKTFPYGQYSLDAAGGFTYRTDQNHTGQITITRCDNVNKIYSGTFSFTGIDTATGQTVNVTEGRFDVKK